MNALDGIGVEEGIFLNRCDTQGDQHFTFLEVLVVRLNDLEDGAVRNGLAELEGRGVRFLAGVSHAATLVRVERSVEVLDNKTAFGDLLLEVEVACLNCNVLARLGPALRHLLEDDTLILNHCVYMRICFWVLTK